MRGAVLLLLGGCSFGLTSAPEPHRPCPTSRTAPILDAAAGAGLLIGSIATVARAGDNYAESDAASYATIAGLGAGLFAIAATRGFGNVESCRAHNTEVAEERLIAQRRSSPTPSRDTAWDLTKQAAAFARTGDCAKVGGIERAVHDLDADFHDSVFVRDVAIARCLAPRLDPMPAAAPTPGVTVPVPTPEPSAPDAP